MSYINDIVYMNIDTILSPLQLRNLNWESLLVAQNNPILRIMTNLSNQPTVCRI